MSLILSLVQSSRVIEDSNSLNHLIFTRKLTGAFGFSRFACELVYSYLTERFQFMNINGKSSRIRPLYLGVPQSSVRY